MAFSPSNKSTKKQEPELREVSASLSDKRREKLLSIKKREEMKDVLVKKFKERVMVGTSTSSAKKTPSNELVIEKNVDDFLEQAAITENNLKRLEKKIIKETGAEEIFDEVSNYSVPIETEKIADAVQSKRIASWSDLDEYAVYLYKKDAIQHKQRIKDAQRNMHTQLDEQVAASMGKMDWIKDEDKKFFEASIQELEDWKLAEADKILEIKKKNIVEKNMRDEQLFEEKKLKAEEKERKLLEEKLAVSRIQKEIVEEKEKIERKKIEDRQAMLKVFKENQENKAKKEEERKAQVAHDIKVMKDYNKLMDKQAKEREAEKQARVDRQKALMDKMQATVGAQAAAKGAEDEIRAAKQKEEADIRTLELEVNKQRKLKQMREENRDYLLKQMQAKADKKTQALELKKMQAQILVEDTKQYEEVEKKKQEDKKLRSYEAKLELQQQIQMKQAEIKNVEMSVAESQINRDLLELVSETLAKRDAEAAA